MKGFILSLKKAKNEDSIATVLTQTKRQTYYRFFGARHSILQLGHLIDFEVEGEDGRFMPRLRSLSHIGFEWLYEKNRVLLWHNFIKMFASHLKDTQEVEPFYYDLLLSSAQKWHKQNPKRIVCESYLKLLKFEGRLSLTQTCFICERPVAEEVALMQGFKMAHPACIYTPSLPREKLLYFFKTNSTILLEDDEVEYLYSVASRGF